MISSIIKKAKSISAREREGEEDGNWRRDPGRTHGLSLSLFPFLITRKERVPHWVHNSMTVDNGVQKKCHVLPT